MAVNSLLKTITSISSTKLPWIPENTFDNLKHAQVTGVLVPYYGDLTALIPYCIGFFLIRTLLEFTIFKWLARTFLDSTAVVKEVPHPSLLAQFKACPRPSKLQYQQFADECATPVVKVTQWFKNMHEATDVKKWTETCWRCTFYVFLTIYGFYNTFYQPWLWNLDLCWAGYPIVTMPQNIKVLYFMQLAVYLNLSVSQFFDVKRKDFLAMFVHHMATILLIGISYVCNFVRYGSLVLLCHDLSDVFLELAKVAKYANYQKFADFNFGLFTISWVLLRLILFPYYVIYLGGYMAGLTLVPPNLCLWFIIILLCILEVLHIYWFGLICNIVYRKLILHREVDDVREDDLVIEEANQADVLRLSAVGSAKLASRQSTHKTE